MRYNKQQQRLSCINLFNTWSKFENFCAKNFNFGSSALLLNKILSAFLVAFTASHRIFKAYGLDTKQAKKR